MTSSSNPVPTHDPLADGYWLARAGELAVQFASQAAQHDATAEPPRAQVDALFEAGLLSLTVARRDGGQGAGLWLARQVVQQVSVGDPSVGLILSMHYAQHAAIARASRRHARQHAEAAQTEATGPWPQALAQRLVHDTLLGPALVNALQVEPELGSPSHGGLPATTAHRVAGGWRLSGRKIYSTGSHLLAWYNVLAVTDEQPARVGHFLVPYDAPGVRIEATWDPLGMRATISHDVVLDSVALDDGQVAELYGSEEGVQRDPDVFAWYLNLVGSVYTGTAIAARDWLLRFLQQRKPTALGGAALASLPTVQDAVGRIELWIQSSVGLLDAHARAFDAGEDVGRLGLAARHTAIEHAGQATALALELAGNHGISRHGELERHYRNAQCARIHAPSAALVRSNLGRAALQLTRV